MTSRRELVGDEESIRARARMLVQEHGPNHAARYLGITRATVLGLAAGAPVQAGTFALIRENLKCREAEEASR